MTGTGYRITPVLGLVPPGVELTPSPHEVEAVLELPIAVLLDPEAPQRRRAFFRELAGVLGVAAPGPLYLGRDGCHPGPAREHPAR